VVPSVLSSVENSFQIRIIGIHGAKRRVLSVSFRIIDDEGMVESHGLGVVDDGIVGVVKVLLILMHLWLSLHLHVVVGLVHLNLSLLGVHFRLSVDIHHWLVLVLVLLDHLSLGLDLALVVNHLPLLTGVVPTRVHDVRVVPAVDFGVENSLHGCISLIAELLSGSSVPLRVIHHVGMVHSHGLGVVDGLRATNATHVVTTGGHHQGGKNYQNLHVFRGRLSRIKKVF